MKIAVAYRSSTGHSKKLANAVAEALNTEALNIKSKPELKGIDILFFAGGIYGGNSLEGTINFMKSLNPSDIKKVALISSSASDKKGLDDVKEILASNKIEVAGEYRCLGNFLFIRMGHPNKKEIAGAVEFAKEIAGKMS